MGAARKTGWKHLHILGRAEVLESGAVEIDAVASHLHIPAGR